MDYSLHDVLGNVGVALVVGAYVALQWERTTFHSTGYLTANAAGAILILFSLIYSFNLSAFVMEAFWLLATLLGFARRRHRSYA